MDHTSTRGVKSFVLSRRRSKLDMSIASAAAFVDIALWR